jgi:DNA-binding MarR family transcriptional regulator
MSDERESPVVQRMASECIAARVRILNRAVTALYDEALRPFGAKVSQMNILVVTAKLGVARPGQICDILHMDASTLSRNAERMVAHGWLEVVPGDDARAQPLRITRRGAKLLERIAPAWEAAQARARSLLGEAGAAAILGSARKLGGPAKEAGAAVESPRGQKRAGRRV